MHAWKMEIPTSGQKMRRRLLNACMDRSTTQASDGPASFVVITLSLCTKLYLPLLSKQILYMLPCFKRSGPPIDAWMHG